MITDAILSFFAGIVHSVLALLPNPSAPDIAGAVSGLTSVWQWFGWANDYLPITEGVALVGILLTAWGGMMAFRAVVWALTKAHVLGGSSE
jgi:hypothetical protein